MSMLPITYRTAVLPAWVDYNGHLRDAYYLLICSFATDGLMDLIGLDEAGRVRSGHTLYTLECHLNYLAEVKLGVELQVRTQLLGHDQAPAYPSPDRALRRRAGGGRKRADADEHRHRQRPLGALS